MIITVLGIYCVALIRWTESENFGFQVGLGRYLFVIVGGLKSRFGT